MSENCKVSFERYAPQGIVARHVTLAIGRRQLQRMYGTVVPEFLDDPFRFLIERTLSSADLPVVEKIEAMRTEMAKRSHELVGVFVGKPTPGKRRSLTDVARVSSVLPLWGTFLYLCAKARGAKTILELGAGAGISGCYLASAPSCTRLVTIEGSRGRAQLAELHLRQLARPAEVVNASFEDGLREILPTLHSGIDLVFLDGTRRLDPMRRLFSRIEPLLNPRCVVILDDIHMTSETWKTWKGLRRLRGFAYAVNVGRMGVCGWDEGEGRPKTGVLFGLAGIDLYGLRRRLRVD